MHKGTAVLLRAGMLAAALMLVQGQAAAQFNQFVFFGDSLTDAGASSGDYQAVTVGIRAPL